MEPDEDVEPKHNFISCVCFVPRGVAKSVPEKVTLTAAEMASVFAAGSRTANDDSNDENEDDDNQMQQDVDTIQNGNATGDSYNFDDYDADVATPGLHINNIADLAPHEAVSLEQDDDSDDEDEIIKPTDNLILVGHIEDDCSSLEVYIYNEEEGSLYVHHDFILPAMPLCITWMNHDAEHPEASNMCAIGSMEPIITVWDLDIQNSLEPAYTLGKKRSARRGIEHCGHTAAVLDLAWNSTFPHILASASVDQSIILWDMDKQMPHTTINAFNEKVQTLAFNPTEPHYLLGGACDSYVKLFDCRSTVSIVDEAVKEWKLADEVEKVVWNPKNTNQFAASTNTGQLFYFDMRQTSQLWSESVHDQEVTGLAIHPTLDGCITTVSEDGDMKIWKCDESSRRVVYAESANIGKIHTLAACPELPFTYALGGNCKKRYFRVMNLLNNDSVRRAFDLQ